MGDPSNQKLSHLFLHNDSGSRWVKILFRGQYYHIHNRHCHFGKGFSTDTVNCAEKRCGLLLSLLNSSHLSSAALLGRFFSMHEVCVGYSGSELPPIVRGGGVLFGSLSFSCVIHHLKVPVHCVYRTDPSPLPPLHQNQIVAQCCGQTPPGCRSPAKGFGA